jgi:uncharacterized protein (TIGR03663 family)
MMRRVAVAVALCVVTVLALSLRLPHLGNRPFHGDEAVHAFKFRELWERGTYRYDPDEFHGPTIYYAALPFVAGSGHHRFADMQEADFRLVIAVVGAAIVPLLLLFRNSIGTTAMLGAALLMALSPAFAFYSRYYIQEIFLVFFTLLFLACVWQCHRHAHSGWSVGAGLFAGLMIATKETAVLAFAAAGIAWLGVSRLRASSEAEFTRNEQDRRAIIRHFLVGSGTALITAYLFLSGFFTNFAGPLGYFYTYTPWLRRAGGTTLHHQPWNYYLSLLAWHHSPRGPIWSEGLILAFALVGAVISFRSFRFSNTDVSNSDLIWNRARFLRFLTFYSITILVIYSVIPYKTPWLVLNFLAPMILLAGVGMAAIIDVVRPGFVKAAFGVLLGVGGIQLGWQAYQTNFVYYMDGRNPYVYAQPVGDVTELKKRAEELAAVHPQKFGMVIKVLSKDAYYWPLPWYLRKFDNVGYWTSIPPDPVAPLVFASPEFDEELTARLGNNYLMTGFYGLRPAVFFQTFVSMEVWEPFIMRRTSTKSQHTD